jgi:hypothetical protein
LSYFALLRKAWKSGDFKISEAEARETDHGTLSTWERVQKEMEEIAEREAGDAKSCMNVHREAIMKLAPFVKFREEKFGAVLFETRSEKVYTLSPTGAAVVREVISGADAAAVLSNLKGKYDDKSGKMEQEATAFIAQLREKGLVTE